MNQNNNNNNNQNAAKIYEHKYVRMNYNLKKEIFSFLPKLKSFNSLYSCNKSFLFALKKTELFNLIQTDNQELKLIITNSEHYDDFIMKILKNRQTDLDTLEETQAYMISHLNKIFSDKKTIEYNKVTHSKLCYRIYNKFLSQSNSIKEIRFLNFDYKEEINDYKFLNRIK